jgi:hypothetical protein
MNIISIVFSMLACVYSVTMYPLDNLPLYQEEMLETDYPEVLYDPGKTIIIMIFIIIIVIIIVIIKVNDNNIFF